MIGFETVLTIKNSNEQLRNIISLYPLRKKEIEVLLNQAGFCGIKFWSNFKKEAYTLNSIPLVFEAIV